MDSIDKLRVLLKHWIDHNGGHVDEFAKWQSIMAGENNGKAAAALDRAIKQMDQVSATLQATLTELGGPLEASEDHHHHHHGHHHDHHH